MSIPIPIAPSSMFALPSDSAVGILAIARIGTRLNTMILMSGSPNSVKFLKS